MCPHLHVDKFVDTLRTTLASSLNAPSPLTHELGVAGVEGAVAPEGEQARGGRQHTQLEATHLGEAEAFLYLLKVSTLVVAFPTF